MAKNTFLSFSTTAGDNTDVGGIIILGSAAVSNFDNAFRTLMAILRGDLDNGTVFVTRSTGYTAVAGDNNAFYEFTATATLSLTAAATLAADWHMMVFANGGAVTVDPNSAELINGAATLTIADGDAAYIICTGVAFKAITLPSAASVAAKQGTSGELYRGLISGLVLTNNASDATNDIDIAAGSAGSDGATPVLMTLASALTKRLDAAWVVGSGNGGLDTGSIANGTYHVWLIQRSDTGVVDALFSVSATSPTMPTNYDRKRRIGSIIRASGAILAFSQRGDEFLLAAQIADVNTAALSTTAVLYALTVPSGVIVDVTITAHAYRAGGIGSVIITSPAASDQAAGAGTAPTSIITPNDQFGAWSGRVRSNASGQIRARASTAISSFLVTTAGWVDTRGRLS